MKRGFFVVVVLDFCFVFSLLFWFALVCFLVCFVLFWFLYVGT